jgi:hypothetical protein
MVQLHRLSTPLMSDATVAGRDDVATPKWPSPRRRGSRAIRAYPPTAPKKSRRSTVATGAVFFAIGSIKSYWSTASWYRSGGETLAIGLAYVVGALLGALV